MPADGGLAFPLGHYVADGSLGTPGIRVGTRTVPVDPPQLTVWLAAHGTVPEVYERAWTLDAARNAARLDGAAFAGAAADLAAAGLLVAVGAEGEEAARFAKAHRFAALLVGLGPVPHAPEWFALGLPGETVTAVPALAYDVWQWGPAAASLWELCEVLAAVEREADYADTAAADLLPDLLGCLHPVLAGHAGYLDLS
jgi:hypothetical protein